MQLPTGTPTFVFVEVPGAVALAEAAGDASWSELVRRVHAVLRRAAEANRGRVVKTEGAAGFVVFADVADAMVGAVDAQVGLRVLGVADGAALAPRIGIHTGPAHVVDEDYVGFAVHRAARVMGAAHPGQVLLSEDTAALARGRLSPGATLRDLGRHGLKDLAPEHLHQLVHPQLVDGHPPPRTLRARRTNLESPLESLLGREDVLAGILGRLVAGARLVTLVGARGSGRRRLLAEVASSLFSHRPGGVWWVPDPGGAPVDAVARVLGCEGDTVATVVGIEPSLIALVDVDPTSDTAARELADLLARVPGLGIVCSSTARLRVRGEHVVEVPPLDVPERGATVDELLTSPAIRLWLRHHSSHSTVDDMLLDRAAHAVRQSGGRPGDIVADAFGA